VTVHRSDASIEDADDATRGNLLSTTRLRLGVVPTRVVDSARASITVWGYRSWSSEGSVLLFFPGPCEPESDQNEELPSIGGVPISMMKGFAS
jgi:hypothetical protein